MHMKQKLNRKVIKISILLALKSYLIFNFFHNLLNFCYDEQALISYRVRQMWSSHLPRSQLMSTGRSMR